MGGTWLLKDALTLNNGVGRGHECDLNGVGLPVI